MTAPPDASRLSTDPRLQRVQQVYEALSPQRLDDLEALFAPDGRFIDPFNDATGRPAIRRVFEHMFATLQQPRFTILGSALQGDSGYLLWDFDFRSAPDAPPRRLQGMSRLVFDAQGQVLLHHDHWDPARQIYEGVPLLGALMRLIRRRLSATGSPV